MIVKRESGLQAKQIKLQARRNLRKVSFAGTFEKRAPGLIAQCTMFLPNISDQGTRLKHFLV